MSLFQELKRRNVFRVGLAYAVAGWLVLQLTDVLSELLDLPATVGPIVVALVAIGFPLALVFAWAFELTPEGVKRESDVAGDRSITRSTGRTLDRAIIVMLVFVAGYFIWESRFAAAPGTEAPTAAAETAAANPTTRKEDTIRNDEAGGAGSTSASSALATIDPRSIAVLPFDNRSRLEDDAFFAEGIHDDLLTSLARIGELKVISRTSVARYADTVMPIPAIAAELGVATVMEGAVQRSGNTVRINVQLIDAKTDEHLWAEIFDRTLTADNLFAIQSEISEQIAAALKTELTASESARLVERPTDNLEAYTAYLRGRQLMFDRRASELTLAMAEFRRATELDPDFALAWVGLAEAAAHSLQYGSMDFAESMEIREAATERALTLDPDLGEAHLAKATIMRIRRQPANERYERAIELSPGNAQAYHWYGNHLKDTPEGIPRAVDLLRKSLEIDPLSSITRVSLATALLRQGHLESAEHELERLRALDPDFPPALNARAELEMRRGRLDRQVAWLRRAVEQEPDNFSNYFGLTSAYVFLEDVESLEQLRAQVLARVDENHLNVAFLDAMRGMVDASPDATLEHLAWIYERMGGIPWIKSIEGYVHTQKGDAARARSAFAVYDARLFDPARWRESIINNPSDACLAGWMMLNTDDAANGQAIIAEAIRYVETELPQYVDHSDDWGVEFCHMALGDVEKTLRIVETRWEHRHLSGWHPYLNNAYFQPLRLDPRFQAINQQRLALIAEQRAAIRAPDLDATLDVELNTERQTQLDASRSTGSNASGDPRTNPGTDAGPGTSQGLQIGAKPRPDRGAPVAGAGP